MRPTANDQKMLDDCIAQLVASTDGITLDDFRPKNIRRAETVARRIRFTIVCLALLFLGLLFLPFAIRTDVETRSYVMMLVAIWSLALGGLGAIASIFLHLLKIIPQATYRSNDEFEIIGRIVLGCLFSTIFGLTFANSEMQTLFRSFQACDPQTCKSQTVMLMLPFLSGYSITLVLGLLEKAIRAVELTIGIEDRREALSRKQRVR